MNRARREAPAPAGMMDERPRTRSWAPPARPAPPQTLVGNGVVAAQALQTPPPALEAAPEVTQDDAAAPAEEAAAAPPAPPVERAAPVQEAPEQAAAAPAAEQLNLTRFTVDLPIPVGAPQETARFDVARFDAATLRPRTPDAGGARDLQAAIGRAQSRYGALLASARQRHDGVARHAQSAQQEIGMAYQQLAGAVPGEMERIDGALDGTLRQHFSAIDTAAQEADARIEAAHQRARRTLGGAVVQGRIAINRNHETADTQISTIVGGLASLYVGTLTTAVTEVTNSSATALASINAWERGAAGTYNAAAGGLLGAENEVKVRAVPGLASAARTGLTTRSAQAALDFTTRIVTVTTDIGGSVTPELNRRRDAIGEHGIAAVNTAFNQASATLREQASQAHASIASMRTDARARAFARRSAARARIEAAATRSVKDARRESDSAQRALGAALLPTLAVFPRSVQQVQEALTAAAPRGAAALDKASAAAQPGVDTATSRAQTAQIEKIDSTRNGVQASMAQTGRQAGVEAAGEQQAADAEIAATVEQDLPAFDETAASQVEGFANVSDGVRAATAQWSEPLADTFAAYITQVQADLTARHDGPVDGNPGFKAQVGSALQPFVDWTRTLTRPAVYFAEGLTNAWVPVNTSLRDKTASAGNALYYGILDTVDEAGLARALRNITAAQGSFIRAVYRQIRSRTLDQTLEFRTMTGDLDRDEYQLALTYLSGDAREGNRQELLAALGTFNDDEARIEEMMRTLSREELEALHATEGWAETAAEVRDDLGGTDLRVFDALDAANPARADALRWRDRMDEARARGETDSLHDTAAEYSGAASYLGSPVEADARRAAVQREFAQLLRESGDISAAQADDPRAAVIAYGTRVTAVMHNDFWRGPRVEMEGLTDANTALFGDILTGGEDSLAARQSRLAVEFERADGPRMLRVDRALVDARLNPSTYPDGVVPPDIAATARAERAQLAAGFRTRFGAADTGAGLSDREYLGSRIDSAFGADRYGANIANLLMYEEVPSPQTASHLMRYAMTHETGTNEALMERVVGRMNRDEIARMSEHYGSFGSSLHADLGVYGQGAFGELSGDERLSMEVRLLGVPRNDRERAEVATFTAQQQRDETGGVGAFLTSGDFQADSLAYETARLRRSSGIAVARDANGVPVFSGGDANFQDGRYVGGDRATFESSTAGAVSASRAYAARVDAYANFAANAIMVIGAVAATIATAGGAGPLLLAAMAAGTGLSAMAARAMISGGRYGWEQALTDLGNTLVQSLTAGLGATLGLASRGGSAAVGTGLRAGLTGRVPAELMRANMGRLTGTALGDTLLIGAATSTLNSVGSTAMNAATWERGIGHGMGELFTAGGTGAFTGMLGAGITHGLGAITPGRISGIGGRMAEANRGTSIADMLGNAAPVTRAVGQGTIAGISGFGTSYANLAIQAGRGTYRGDAGDMFTESRDAGLQAGLQGMAESFGEQYMQHRAARAEAARVAALPPAPDAAPVVAPVDPDTDSAGIPPRPPPDDGAGPPRPPPDDDRLFPNLTDAEIDAAFDVADSRLMVRVGADQLGADARPLRPPEAGEPTLAQRQRAGALLEEAGRVAQQAEATLAHAIARDAEARMTEAWNPRRAAAIHAEVDDLVAQAVALEGQAGTLRGHADDYASGRRPVSADLPDTDALLTRLDSQTLDATGTVQVPRSQAEQHPEMLERLVRSLISGEEGGRLEFRVESERSRQLISIDANGNVTVAGGASVHLNFGSFERAVEFVLDHSRGAARIFAFEVDEAWVRAARSAAIPEHETAALAGRQPRLVDVRFGDDQMEIPPGLISEMNRFIAPGSGMVFDIPATRPRPGPVDDGSPPATLHSGPGEMDAMRQALLRHVPGDQHDAMAGVPIRVLPADQYQALTRSESGPVVTIIEDGRPTVIVREGTPIGRLADEGPHLSQAHDVRTRTQVGQLDEARLANWDNLDIDTQVALYRNKIELEIDAHTRIAASLEREGLLPGADPRRLAQESERNWATLRNLEERRAEVAALSPGARAAIAAGTRTRPQYLDQPARLFSKGPPYSDQPDLRAPQPATGVRAQHEQWTEYVRRFLLDPGSMPVMASNGRPVLDASVWHDTIQDAYASYDAVLRASGGSSEVGIVRDPVSGRYMVAQGDAVGIAYRGQSGRPETVLHYHPEYGPALLRGPSGIDLDSAIGSAQRSGRPQTEFIEHGPADRRGRTAFTVTPVEPGVPGGRVRIDIEYTHPSSGEYVNIRFNSREEWHDYYHGRTIALDPDGPVYRALMAGRQPDTPDGTEPAVVRQAVIDPVPVPPAHTHNEHLLATAQRGVDTVDQRIALNQRRQGVLEEERALLQRGSALGSSERIRQIDDRLMRMQGALVTMHSERARFEAQVHVARRALAVTTAALEAARETYRISTLEPNARAAATVASVTVPVDFEGHIFNATVRPDGRVTGGHSTATGQVRVIPGSAGPPNAEGVYAARILIADPANPGLSLTKGNNQGITHMFPDSWTADRVRVEVDFAYRNRTELGDEWMGITESGVRVKGYLRPYVTVFPLY